MQVRIQIPAAELILIPDDLRAKTFYFEEGWDDPEVMRAQLDSAVENTMDSITDDIENEINKYGLTIDWSRPQFYDKIDNIISWNLRKI